MTVPRPISRDAFIGVVLITLSLLITSCGGEALDPMATTSATDSPTPLPAASSTQEAPPATAAAAAPVLPTETPAGPPPVETPQPRLIYQRPYPGEELALNGKIALSFSHNMNRVSVEGALTISPAIDYSIGWVDDRSLEILPAEGQLEQGTAYTITVGSAATSTEGENLFEAEAVEVNTVGALSVSEVIPAEGTGQVALDAVITVMFNRPVVPLVIVENLEQLPQPLSFEPVIPGEGEWLNTSIYVWHPSEPLTGGQTYTATVSADLVDPLGAGMEEAFTWDFITIGPAITAVAPQSPDDVSEAAEYRVRPDAEIRVSFNQPMDRTSTQSAFQLVNATTGRQITGSFSWEEDDQVLVYRPFARLDLNSLYRLTLATEASNRGGVQLSKPYSDQFRTLPLPAIQDTWPDNGGSPYSMSAVEIYFNTIMNRDSLLSSGRITVTPAIDGVRFSVGDRCRWWHSSACELSSLSVGGTFKPRTTYTVTVNPGARDIYGNSITEPYSFSFTTEGLGSRFQINMNERIGFYDATLPTTVILSTLNVNQTHLELASISTQQLSRFLTDYDYRPPSSSVIRSWTVTSQAPQDEVLVQPVNLTEDGSALPLGLYVLSTWTGARSLNNTRLHLVVVGNAHLTMKYSFDESLAWVTDLQTGQPIEGASVRFFSDYALAGEGITDADGIITTATTYSDEISSRSSRYAIVEGDGIFGMSFAGWQSGIGITSYGLTPELYDEDTTFYLYTDRPIYQPGQTLYFKGIVRSVDDMAYAVPDGRVSVAICRYVNGSDHLVQQFTLDLNEMGSFAGDLTLDEDASLGTYWINAVRGTSLATCDSYSNDGTVSSIEFEVAEYRKPEFEVLVDAPEHVLAGEYVTAGVNSQYFFGSAMPFGTVAWQIRTFPYQFEYTGTEYYSFRNPSSSYTFYSDYYYLYGGYWDTSGEYLTEGSGVADENGQFDVSFVANSDDDSRALRYHVQAQVTDTAGYPVTGSTDVIVHDAEYYVGIRAEKNIGYAGRSQAVHLVVVDWESNPIPFQTVQLQFVRREWNYSVSYAPYSDGPTYRWVATDTPVGSTISVTTDEQGKATVQLAPPQAGALRLQATVIDPQGHQNTSSTNLWVSGSRVPYWRNSITDAHIDIAADKTTYQPGETASILITSPYEGEVRALVTIERGGILAHEVISFSGPAYTYELPITAEHVPNIFVSAILIDGGNGETDLPGFRMGLIELKVEHNEQTLNLMLTPNTESVLPGGEVTYDIRVTDWQGQPVLAEVSLALVDRAVLNLAPPNSSPIDQFFYADQGLSVLTALPFTAYVPRLAVELLPEGGGMGGGGGGGPPGPLFEEDNLRDEFRDTAYWSAFVQTNEQGEAQVTVPLPENTTSWRLDARAVTSDTLVGQSTVDITATLPLLIRPQTPRFFVVGDQVTLSAIVNNNTAEAIEAVVSLEVTGVSLLDEANSSQTVSIPANNRVEVVWPISVAFDTDWVDLTFRVEGGGFSDAVKPEIGDPEQAYALPVYRYEVPETVGTAGQIIDGGARVEGILLPPQFEVTQGHVDVQVSPSLAASNLDALTWLNHYPYECSEQTASRVLPNALTLQALQDFEIEDPELEAHLRSQIDVGLGRLYVRQNSDGGWGWWPTDRSHPYVTAYVMHALLAARDAGFEVPDARLGRGVSYLIGQLNTRINRFDEEWELNRKVYILYVLTLAGESEEERIQTRLEEAVNARAELSLYAQALLAQTLWRVEPEHEVLETIQSDLLNAAVLSATGAHWEESYHDYWNWNTDTRTTAIVLDTFALLWPDNDLAPNALRWLMVAREADHWTTTQETVWALIALNDWMQATGELDASYHWTVTLNESELGSGDANRDTITTSSRYSIDIDQLLTDTANQLTIQRDYGAGRLYYTTHLTAYLPVEQIDALSRGVIISRRYLDSAGNPVTQARTGDVLDVEITVIAPNELHYLIIEDYYPAGADAVDSTLLTEGELVERPSVRWENPLWWGWGWWWFSHVELHDEKAVLSTDYLPRGTYVFTYQIRLGVPGEYRVIPPVASEFYFPEVYGRGEGSLFIVSP